VYCSVKITTSSALGGQLGEGHDVGHLNIPNSVVVIPKLLAGP
jgi:hypothetical protein